VGVNTGRGAHNRVAFATAIAAVIAASASLLAVVTANRANDIAQMNAESRPEVRVAAIASPVQPSAFGPLCFWGSPPNWQQDFVVIVDVSNSGPVGVALLGIGSDFQEFVGPSMHGQATRIYTELAGSLFTAGDEVQAWLTHRQTAWTGPGAVALAGKLDGVEFVGLPVHLDPGASHRVAIRASTTWTLPVGIGPDQLASLDVYGSTSQLTFTFSNGDEIGVNVAAPTPADSSFSWPSPYVSVPSCPDAIPSGVWPPQ
jgi:hypothetical protein